MAYIATGRVATEPELASADDGVEICTFRLAATRLDRCGNPQTEWFMVRLHGDDAAVARDTIAKGADVVATGTLRPVPGESRMLIDGASVALSG